MRRKRAIHKMLTIGLVLILVYLGIGLAFHLGWKQAQDSCRVERLAQGEFVEPEVFPLLGVFFDMTWWPVYVAADLYHDGTPFATPCTH